MRASLAKGGLRAPVAIIADDDERYRWLPLYEARCADAGVRVIRVFRDYTNAEAWLDTVSAARRFT